MCRIRFIDENGTFQSENPEKISYLYFPLAGEKGLKSSVTPSLGGDAKLDQESFLLRPVSVEDLHESRSTRNFWCIVDGLGCWSATGSSCEQEALRFTDQEERGSVTAGFMWYRQTLRSEKYRLESEITLFIPPEENAELMLVRIRNEEDTARYLTAIPAVPIYGRSADNLRDHRNVTSMLHRIYGKGDRIEVKPTMSFDEKGHRENHRIYYAAAFDENGNSPESCFPTVEQFVGEGGTFTHPRAVMEFHDGVPMEFEIAGKEACGAFCFPEERFGPGEEKTYLVILGIAEEPEEVKRVLEKYRSIEAVQKSLEETKDYWNRKVNISFRTGNKPYDGFLRWVSFQPYLRRLFGCSFLPYHDYGRGGRGWRDLWQDCLSLLLMDPSGVGELIKSYYGGVRMDGTNATIIGAKEGEFIADRNGIARVWMDHALWPFKTTKLYIDQTGDLSILKEEVPYFKDAHVCRGTELDGDWKEEDGNLQRKENGEVYRDTVLSHLLIQHLTAFLEVGSHNMMRLRGADWNDALDMAWERGESVAFTAAYAGNLEELSALMQTLLDAGETETLLPIELLPLIRVPQEIYRDAESKRKTLADYAASVRHTVKGESVSCSLTELRDSLKGKAEFLKTLLREQEWISGEDGEGWFNSYYDNDEQRVEGFFPEGVRMMLTGQVFSIMSGTAEPEQIKAILRAADHYLYRKEIGGYRLNTDFHQIRYNLGRMFGFAYGEKENGSVFSHMAVMFGNALYSRGFVQAGYTALKSLANTSMDSEISRMYPGIPEYFNADGRGMYPYLTGAASWYLLTMLTEVYGVKGRLGDLLISPKLLPVQFDEKGETALRFPFRGKSFELLIRNTDRKDYGEYRIGTAKLDGRELAVKEEGAVLSAEELEQLSEELHRIELELI